MSSSVCISSSKAPPSNTLKVWSGLSTCVRSCTSTYPLPFSNFPRKLPKILVGARSFFSFHLSSANTICEALLFTNPIVAIITSQIIRAVFATGFSGE